MRAAPRQLQLGAPRRGGRRAGAGRPRGRTSKKIPHIARPALSRHHPVHAILRVRADVTNLRSGPAFAVQMKSPAQVRHTLRYVFRNVEHHRGSAIRGPDVRATEMYLSVRSLPAGAPVSSPRTWLLTVGWRRISGRPWPPPSAADVPG